MNLNLADKEELKKRVRGQNTPNSEAQRARIILLY